MSGIQRAITNMFIENNANKIFISAFDDVAAKSPKGLQETTNNWFNRIKNDVIEKVRANTVEAIDEWLHQREFE